MELLPNKVSISWFHVYCSKSVSGWADPQTPHRELMYVRRSFKFPCRVVGGSLYACARTFGAPFIHRWPPCTPMLWGRNFWPSPPGATFVPYATAAIAAHFITYHPTTKLSIDLNLRVSETFGFLDNGKRDMEMSVGECSEQDKWAGAWGTSSWLIEWNTRIYPRLSVYYNTKSRRIH